MEQIKQVHKKKMIAPKLRFKGFGDSWSQKKLNTLAEINPSNKNLPEKFIYIDLESVVKGQLLKENEILKDGSPSRAQRYLQQNDILFQMVRPYQMNNLFFDKIGYYVASTGYAQIRTKENSKYIYQYLHLQTFVDKVIEKCTGTSYPSINSKDLGNIQIGIPTLPEQQKIASFLWAVDEKIAVQRQYLASLRQYKKGVMQQLFSGKLRFKDENGKAYPKWEEKTLFDISENVSYGMNAAAKEFDGIHKYIRITDIDVDSGKFIPNPLTSPEGKIDEKFRLKENDIVFARTGASVGKSYLYNPKDGKIYYAGFLIKFSIVNANSYFIYSLTLRDTYYKWVHVYSMRSGQPGLNAEEYKALKFKLPCLEEQKKIADFLSAIDVKIESLSKQINQTQTFKKGLLQQMFV